MVEKYPQLDAKPRMMLKTIAFKTLTATSEEYGCDMSYLNGLA